MSKRTRTTRVPDALCPHCGYRVDSASALGDAARPDPGDWSVCLRCGGVLMLDAALRPVLPAFGAYEALRITNPRLYAKIERTRAGIRILAAEGNWIPDRGSHT